MDIGLPLPLFPECLDLPLDSPNDLIFGIEDFQGQGAGAVHANAIRKINVQDSLRIGSGRHFFVFCLKRHHAENP